MSLECLRFFWDTLSWTTCLGPRKKFTLCLRSVLDRKKDTSRGALPFLQKDPKVIFSGRLFQFVLFGFYIFMVDKAYKINAETILKPKI